MKKISMYFLFVCLLLTGCSSDKTKQSAENRKNLTVKYSFPQNRIAHWAVILWMGMLFIILCICQWEIMRKIRMHNLMFPWKQKSGLLSGEETELLKAEQDSFEWMFLRGETLCTKNGNDIYVLSMK